MKQENELNRLFPLIKVDCFTAKTGKIVIFNIAEDCCKVHTVLKNTYFGNPTKTVFGEGSKKLVGIVENVSA